MGRKEDGFDPSPKKYTISGNNNANYFSTSCKYRAADHLSESLERRRRVPAPYITNGELMRLVSSASRLVEAADVNSLAGRLAALPRANTRQDNVCGRRERDMFLPPIQVQGDTKRKSQCRRRVEGRGGGTRKRSKQLLRCNSPDVRAGRADRPCVTAVRKGREKSGGTGSRGREGGEEEGSHVRTDTPIHAESCRICREPCTEKLSHTDGYVANSKDLGGEDDRACIPEEEGAAADTAESSAALSLQSQANGAGTPCLLRTCLALSGDTGSLSDRSDPEGEQKDGESTSPGDAEEQTAESRVPTLETV